MALDTETQIVAACTALQELLVEKNRAYGDSALSPLRILSRAGPEEQIKVRIDDKLSRLARGHELPDESFDQTIDDLLGYLVLLKIARHRGAP
jgi:hypothetical protein